MDGFINQIATTTSGIGALGINVSSFLIQLGTFIVAFLILRQWAFKPILRLLKERRDTIEKGVNLGELMKKQQAELDERVTKTLRDARQEADDILSKAQTEAHRIVRSGEETASQKADNLIAEAKNKILLDTRQARKEIEKDVISLVSSATEAIIHEKVDRDKDSALISRALQERGDK